MLFHTLDLGVVLVYKYYVPVIKDVQLEKSAEKDLKKVPVFILRKFMFWIDSIVEIGFEETRKSKGFHDDPFREKERSRGLFKRK